MALWEDHGNAAHQMIALSLIDGTMLRGLCCIARTRGKTARDGALGIFMTQPKNCVQNSKSRATNTPSPIPGSKGVKMPNYENQKLAQAIAAFALSHVRGHDTPHERG